MVLLAIATARSTDVASVVLAVVSGVIALVGSGIAARSLRRIRVGGFELTLGNQPEGLTEAVRISDFQDKAFDTIRRLDQEVGGDVSQEAETKAGAELRALRDQLRDLLARAERQRTAVDQRTEHLLREYHSQGLAQSRVAFLFSIVFASLGFVLIAATVVVAVAVRTHTGANAVALISGAIVEAVSGLFFVQSNRARITMTAFFDKLRQDRSLEEALRLSDSIPDALIRSRLKTILSLRLASADASDDALKTVLAGSRSEVVGSVESPGPETEFDS